MSYGPQSSLQLVALDGDPLLPSSVPVRAFRPPHLILAVVTEGAPVTHLFAEHTLLPRHLVNGLNKER